MQECTYPGSTPRQLLRVHHADVPDTPSDRREHARVPVNTRAMVLVRHNAGVPLTIESISLGGARLVGEISVMVGDPIQILFEVEGHPIDITGEVVRTEKADITTDHIAVRFTELDDATKARIERLVHGFLDLEEQRLKT